MLADGVTCGYHEEMDKHAFQCMYREYVPISRTSMFPQRTVSESMMHNVYEQKTCYSDQYSSMYMQVYAFSD